MQLSLDGKSLALGLFAGAALVAGIGAAQNDPPQPGRFQIAAAGSDADRYRAYLVDTVTGEVWGEPQEYQKDQHAAFFKPKAGLAP